MIQRTNCCRLYLIIALYYIILLFPKNLVSQNIVTVNNLTGTANATIPIYNATVGDLSAPVALSYNATGLKVENYDNSFGQGWNLIAPASIIREVRGFPDDVEHESSPLIRGWIRSGNSAPQTIQGLTFANDGTLNCGNEITDATTIANNFSYPYDTEPDYFYVSAPGLSCSFVFDGTTNHGIKIIPYRDYQITYTTESFGRINAFTVINENGIKYYFDLTHFIKHNIPLINPGTTVPIDPSTLEVLKRDFLIYSKISSLGYEVIYGDKWMLTKMEDTKGHSITFNYGDGNYTILNPEISNQVTNTKVEILKPDGIGGFIKKKLYEINKGVAIFHIRSISITSLGPGIIPEAKVPGPPSSVLVVQFNWGVPSGSGQYEDEKLVSIDLPLEKKTFELLYTKKFLGSPNVWFSYGRYYLKGLKISNTSGLCDNVYSQFDFTYYAVNQYDNTCYCTPVIPGTGNTLDTLINAQDYWGYYNGKVTNTNLDPTIYVYPNNPGIELFKVYPIPGNPSGVTLTAVSDRSANEFAIDGSLEKITYPTGGTTVLLYENNEFFDKDVNGNIRGAGIRIKSITNNDGLGTPNDVTEYSYNDPDNPTLTTGRAISVPKFTMAFQNSNNYGGNVTDQVKNSTYRTTYDLNNESKDILYGKVTIKKTGIGKSVYEYNTTGTFRSSAITGWWEESMNWIARTNLSSPTPCNAITPSFLNNGTLQYPFNSNPNFDFERGLPTKVTHYNEAGQVVASEEYTYTHSHTNPTKIFGVKLDEIGNTMAAYGKYQVNSVVDNFLTTKTSKLYNSNSVNPVTDVENYIYTSPGSTDPFRLLKEMRKQNSGDLAIAISRFKYSKEYAATNNPADFRNYAIYNLNIRNNNTLIESTRSRLEGGIEKFTGGSLNTFKEFTLGDVVNAGATVKAYLPYELSEFVNQAGTTSFVPSSVNPSGIFTWDQTNYTNPPSVIAQYNTMRAIPQVITDNSLIPKTILSSIAVNSVKVAEVTNALAENVGFSDFDNTYTGNFTIGMGNTVQPGGRHSTNCLDFQPNTYLCKAITKSLTTNKFIISFWLKDAQVNGNIFLCFSKSSVCPTNACGGPSIVSFTPGSQWKYYQVYITWGNPSNTILSYSLGTSTAVKIDDVLIYPDNSNITTWSYTTNAIGTNMLTAKTGINGIGNSYEYDNAGRLWLVRDQFDNIIEMKKYKLTNRYTQQIPSIDISYPYQTVVNTPAWFTAVPPFAYETGDCDAPPIVYNWNFGDGNTGVSNGSGIKGASNISHVYTMPGKYQVFVTASSPGMNDAPGNTPPATNLPPNPPPVEIVTAPAPCSPGTPQICASGIIQYTSTGQCILSNCFSLPSTCSDTYFQVSGVTGGSINSVYSVEWQTAPEGSSSWTTYQPETPGANITSVHFHNVHTATYQMRAMVRFCYSQSNGGTTAFSNAILVKNGDF